MSEDNSEIKSKVDKVKRLYKLYNLDPQFLCAYIILYKIFGMNKDLASDAMEVLYYRVNVLKENFDYNSYLKEKMATIPTIPEFSSFSKNGSGVLKDITSFIGTFKK